MNNRLLHILPLLIPILFALTWQRQQRPAIVMAAAPAGEPNAAAPTAPDAEAADTGAAPGPSDQEIQTEFEKWIVKLRDAGIAIPILLVLSVIGLSLILERLWNVRRRNFAPRALIQQVNTLWQLNQWDELSSLCRKNRSTYAGVIAFILAHRKGTPQDVSTAAGDIASRDLRRHLLRAYPLAIIATCAPLLGLFGTVSGMVGAFDTVAMMGELGDAGALGGDISKALVTTLVGLVVAIPALFAYHFFKARTQFFAVVLEEEITTFITEHLMPKEVGHADRS